MRPQHKLGSRILFLRKAATLSLLFSFTLSPLTVFGQETQSSEQIPNVVVQETEQEPTISNENTLPSDDESETSQNSSEEVPSDLEQEIVLPSEEESLILDPEIPESQMAIISDDGDTSEVVKSVTNEKNLAEIDEASGALKYSILLDLPPGRGGLDPKLELQYSSQTVSNSSIFGYGWSMNIPYIERTNLTGNEDLYTQQHFYSSLSGELATTSASTEYRARVDDGSSVQYKYDSNVWTAYDKEGNIYKFGHSTQGQLNSVSTSTDTYRWMLEEIRDPNDNYITYTYSKDTGQIYPDQITYTNHASSTGLFSVEFDYESRTDISTSTAYGFTVATKQRVNTILIKEGGNWVRKYDLDYSTGDNGTRQLLQSVTKSGKDSLAVVTQLPAITFEYETASTTSWATQSLGSNLTFDEAVRYGDVNGDGLNDVVYSGTGSNGYKAILLNKGGSWESVSTDGFPNVSFFWKSNSSQTDDKIQYARLADLNGDLLADIYDTESGDTYINNGDLTWSLQSGWNYDPYAPESVQLADVNGDGLVDLIYSWQEQGFSSVNKGILLNTGSGWATEIPADGLPDNEFFWICDSSNCKDKVQPVSMIDVNGDGLADYHNLDGGSVSLNMGNLTWETSPTWSFTVPNNPEAIRYGDINNDGLVDLISSYQHGNYSPYIHVYINQGNTWTEDSNWSSSFPAVFYWYSNSSQTPSKNYDMGLADFDGDGVMDVYTVRDDNFSINPGTHVDLLTHIQNEIDGDTTVTYTQSTLEKDSGVLSNPRLPLAINVVDRIFHTDSVGTNQETEYTYRGGDYYFSTLLDKKFAGFESIEEESEGRVQKTFFHQGNGSSTSTEEVLDTYYKIGKPFKTEISDDSDNLFKILVTTWNDATSTANSHFVTKKDVLELNYDGNSTHNDRATSYQYDSSGNVTQKMDWGQVTGSEDGTFIDVNTDAVKTTLGYATSSTPYLHVPSSEKIEVASTSVKLKESKYFYDTLAAGLVTKGNLTSREDWVASSTFVVSENSFNEFGLVSTSTDPRGNETQYDYDSYNLYPASVTNALNHTTTYIYDYGTGKVKEVTDGNGYLSEIIYDGLGRVIQQRKPDHLNPTTTVITEEYDYSDSSSPFKIKKTEYLTSGVNKDTYYYFDGLGRVIQTRASAEDSGVFTVRDVKYDARGLKLEESLPYFSNNSSRTSSATDQDLYTSYEYDPLDRVTSIKTSLGTILHEYDDIKDTVTDANENEKIFHKDYFERLSQVDEKIGTSTYSTLYGYDGIGNLIRITDAKGNIRNFTYDGLSRRLTAEDLHTVLDSTFGTWSYSYDEAGNVTQITDPKSQVINYSYDDLNRPLIENFQGLTGDEVTYAYDACTGGIGRLCEADSGSVSTLYTYTPTGEVEAVSKSIDSVPYVLERTYDKQGNVASIEYPDGSVTEYLYNDANLVDEVSFTAAGSASSTLISKINYDPAAQPLTISYGTAATSTYKYDKDEQYRLTHKTSSSTSATLQKLSYEYDPVGNVTKIIEGSGSPVSRIVDYSYDDLYRLTVASTSATAYGYATTSTTSPFAHGRDYFLKLSIPGANASGTQMNMPVYVNLADMPASFFSHASSTCADIRVFARNRTTELPREIVSCDTVNKTGEMHFKADFISSASTTNDFYIHYGTTTPFTAPARNSTYGADNVWTNYGVVYHLNQDPGGTAPQLKDSTTNQRNATTEGGMSGNTNFKVGKGVSFDDYNDAASFSNAVPGTNPFVISMWALESGQGTLFAGVNDNLMQIFVSMDTSLAAGMNWRVGNSSVYLNAGTGSGYNNGVPRYIQVLVANNGASNRARMEIYSNGQFVAWGEHGSLSYNVPSLSRGWFLGKTKDYRRGGDESFFGGDMDEVRYFNGTTSASRILTEYNNQASTTAFYNIGVEELPTAIATTTILLATSSYAYKLNYAYDELGNILSNTSAGTYTYGQTGYANPHAPTQVASTTYTYDQNGNLTSAGSLSNTWDYRNRLASTQTASSTISYVYDHENDRMKYTAGTTTIISPFKEYEIDGSKIKRNIYLGDQLLATVETVGSTTNTHYILTDHLQGTNVVIDEQGSPVEHLDYSPYGSVFIDQKINGFDESKKYIGQDYDRESQLSYLNARYYDGARGQFLSQDPSFLDIGGPGFEQDYERTLQQHLMNPQALNSYSYGLNNPITNKDPDGEIVPLLIGAWALAEIGLSAYDAYQTGSTLVNPNASLNEKAVSVGGFAAGLALPGGGYGTGGKKALEIAENGGKHSGFLKNYIEKSTKEIERGIRSLDKQIQEHTDKIRNPEKYVPNWKQLDSRQRDHLQNTKWQSDIQRQTEQRDILKGIKDRR